VSTGCARLKAASLHPRLHPAAPPGPRKGHHGIKITPLIGPQPDPTDPAHQAGSVDSISMSAPHSILFVLNSGKASRHYIAGLAAAARAEALPHHVFDLAPFWKAQRQGFGPAAAEHLVNEAKIAGVKRVVGYAHNPIAAGIGPGGVPVNVFAREGIACTLFWTDHPEWATGGDALLPNRSAVLAHPLHTHIVKSAAAAAEVRGVLGCGPTPWQNVTSMRMAESVPGGFPQCKDVPMWDAVMIVSDAQPPTDISQQYLCYDDPSPREIDTAHAPAALTAAEKAARSHGCGDLVKAVAPGWIQHKLIHPELSWWQVFAATGGSPSWLTQSPTLYYNVVAALRRLHNWRRNFWPAWLARRAHLGVFGCDASCWGVTQTDAQRTWVDYHKLSDVYRQGACAITINAGHDEQGLTHKPFQIACAGVPLIHHATVGLADAFTLKGDCAEVYEFVTGPQLMEAVGAARLERTRSESDTMAYRAWSRCLAQHDWKHRLGTVLAPVVGALSQSTRDQTSDTESSQIPSEVGRCTTAGQTPPYPLAA
jgi:hypothetical protein